MFIQGNDNGNILEDSVFDDRIVGDARADTLDGGSGHDTVSFAASAVGIRVTLGTLRGYGGDAEGDSVSGFESVIGSQHNDTLSGNPVTESSLSGGAGTVSYLHQNGNMLVAAWVSAIAAPDLVIALQGIHSPGAQDFML